MSEIEKCCDNCKHLPYDGDFYKGVCKDCNMGTYSLWQETELSKCQHMIVELKQQIMELEFSEEDAQKYALKCKRKLELAMEELRWTVSLMDTCTLTGEDAHDIVDSAKSTLEKIEEIDNERCKEEL